MRNALSYTVQNARTHTYTQRRPQANFQLVFQEKRRSGLQRRAAGAHPNQIGCMTCGKGSGGGGFGLAWFGLVLDIYKPATERP